MLNLKVRILHAFVMSILLYRCELWIVDDKLESHINTFSLNCNKLKAKWYSVSFRNRFWQTPFANVKLDGLETSCVGKTMSQLRSLLSIRLTNAMESVRLDGHIPATPSRLPKHSRYRLTLQHLRTSPQHYRKQETCRSRANIDK